MQSVQVSSKDGKTASFKKLIISKCQSLFELDKAQEMDSAKKLTEINSCKDPVILKALKTVKNILYIMTIIFRKKRKNFNLNLKKMKEDYANVL